MKISEISELLSAEVLCGNQFMDQEVSYAFGSDLMSDVLAYVKGQTVLLTGLTNPQVIRTAEMADVNVIIFVRGKRPDMETINLAEENNMVLLLTKDTMFTSCGKLYNKGLQGIEIDR